MRKVSAPPPAPAPLFRHGGTHPATAVLDFSASINPLGPPLSVVHALRRHLAAIARYPDPDCRALVERVARYHGVPPEAVVPGNGSSELVQALPRLFGRPRVAIVEPAYTEYLRASLLAGATVTHWLAEGDTFALGPFDPEEADLVWLCNPNNPTGQMWPSGVLVPWVAAHPRTLFVVDESFLSFRADEADHSLVPALRRLDNLVVLRSLTKLYALPGLRLGYAVTSAAWAERLRAQLVPWSVNALAQVAGVTALDEGAYLERTRAWLAAELPVFRAELATCSIPWRVLPAQANFVLLRLEEGDAHALAARLLRRGVAVRLASNFVGLDRRYLRVAVRQRPDNRRLVDELRRL